MLKIISPSSARPYARLTANPPLAINPAEAELAPVGKRAPTATELRFDVSQRASCTIPVQTASRGDAASAAPRRGASARTRFVARRLVARAVAP